MSNDNLKKRSIISDISGTQSINRASTMNTTNDKFNSFLVGTIDKRRTLDDSIEGIPEREDL